MFGIYLQFQDPILWLFHDIVSLLLYYQVIKNTHKLITIVKIYKFHSLFEAIVVYIETLNRPQKKAITLFYTLIKLSNLSKIQRGLNKDNMFEFFAVKSVQEMVKVKMFAIAINLKLIMASFKICVNARKEFFMMTIHNEYVKIAPILRFLLRALASNISVLSYFSCWEGENLDGNNRSNKSKVEEKIKLDDKIYQSKIICQSNRVKNQFRQDLVLTAHLSILSYA